MSRLPQYTRLNSWRDVLILCLLLAGMQGRGGLQPEVLSWWAQA